jgi:hypothetical protein
MPAFDGLIVGTGLAGSVLAERLASQLGHKANMDQVVGQALATFTRICEQLAAREHPSASAA